MRAQKPPIADVAIVGASFAGLALALALSRAGAGGLEIALIERADLGARAPASPGHADTRVSALSAATKHFLDALGVWARLADHAEPVRRIEITDTDLDAGIRPVVLAYDNLVDGQPASFIIENTRLREALWDAVRVAPGVRIIAPAAVGTLAACAFSVRLCLAGPKPSVLEARLVVAADGRGSMVREAAQIATRGWPYRQTGIVVTITHELALHGTAVQHFLPGGPFAILPLPGNRAGITWSEERDEAARILALAPARILAELETRIGGRLGSIGITGPVRSWPLDLTLAQTMTGPRVALAGDAARSVHPIAGQGLNLAMRDCAALSEIIADAVALGGDPGSVTTLERYQSWRGFDSVASAAAFDGLNRLFSNDHMVARAGRELGMGLLDRAGVLKSLLVREAAGLAGAVPLLMRGAAGRR